MFNKLHDNICTMSFTKLLIILLQISTCIRASLPKIDFGFLLLSLVGSAFAVIQVCYDFILFAAHHSVLGNYLPQTIPLYTATHHVLVNYSLLALSVSSLPHTIILLLLSLSQA